MARKKFYAIKKGRENFVITDSWDHCSSLVTGYPGAVYKGFSSREAAEAWLYDREREYEGVPKDALFCDAGTHGNPGQAEAQVTDINGNVLIRKDLGVRTNNYAELAALGMAIVKAIELGRTVIYNDSATVQAWIVNGNPRVKRDYDKVKAMIDKIQKLLREHPEIQIRKWDTDRFGEIPADFGRK